MEAYYAMPHFLWSRFFVEVQVCAVDEIKFHQDYMSDTLIENNGKDSRMKWIKHILVRYFFIKDRIENGDLSLKYFPTGEMYADLFTKLYQGATFRRFQAVIKGIPKSTLNVYMSCPRSMAKFTSHDCVGKNYRQTCGTATTIMDSPGSTCTNFFGSTLTDK